MGMRGPIGLLYNKNFHAQNARFLLLRSQAVVLSSAHFLSDSQGYSTTEPTAFHHNVPVGEQPGPTHQADLAPGEAIGRHNRWAKMCVKESDAGPPSLWPSNPEEILRSLSVKMKCQKTLNR